MSDTEVANDSELIEEVEATEEEKENLDVEEVVDEESLLVAHEKSEQQNAELEAVDEGEIIDSLDMELAQESFVEGSELENFVSAEVEEQEFLEHERVVSIVESILFATDRPQSMAILRQAFKGTQIKSKDIRKAIDELMVEYAGGERGITLEEINGGFQLRTKVDNMEYLKRMIKGRSFKLSGPALEVLAITAYKQPCIKSQVDEIRGVESGHLMRGLMERGLLRFAGKSDLPGKPMLYETTRKFLEIFGLRNLKELPSLSEIDDLIPEGIGEIEEEKETLDQLTGDMSKDAGTTYSEGEEELEKITGQLTDISTSSEFFEQEKLRVKAKKEADKAQMIREALIMEEEVSNRDKNWLERYDTKIAEEEIQAKEAIEVTEGLTEEVESVEGLVASEETNQEAESAAKSDLESAEEDLPDSIESAFTPESNEEIQASGLPEINMEKLKNDMEIFAEDKLDEAPKEDEA